MRIENAPDCASSPCVKGDLNALTQEIIAAATAVHRARGPGLLESAYDACLSYEVAKRKLNIERQNHLPVVYDGVKIDCAYRLDFLVEDRVASKSRRSNASLTSTKRNSSRT